MTLGLDLATLSVPAHYASEAIPLKTRENSKNDPLTFLISDFDPIRLGISKYNPLKCVFLA
jgi:hypothetical protein